jgi:glycyl-tRNA synthetase (class II)
MSRPSGSELMERIVALAKRRGFVFPASEIYGGLNGFWDYGPLGTQLKNNLRDAWWHDMVLCPPIGPDGHPVSIVGLDSAIIQNPRTWEASGHVAGFSDPMVRGPSPSRAPFNLMFFTYVRRRSSARRTRPTCAPKPPRASS